MNQGNSFFRIFVCCLLVWLSVISQTSKANASSVYISLPDTFFSTNLYLSGSFASGYTGVSIFLSIPGFIIDNPDQWLIGASANVGPTGVVFYRSNSDSIGRSLTSNGFYLPDELPTILTIDGSASGYNARWLSEPVLQIILPDGVTVTPLPAALPLFATGLGTLSLIAWRRKRRST